MKYTDVTFEIKKEASQYRIYKIINDRRIKTEGWSYDPIKAEIIKIGYEAMMIKYQEVEDSK